MDRRQALGGLMAVATAPAWSAPTLPGQPAEPALSIETLFQRPAFLGATLSPDGQTLAASASVGGRWNLVTVDLATRKAVPLTHFTDNDVFNVHWVNDSRLVFSTGDLRGLDSRGNGGLVAVDKDGGNLSVLVKPYAGRGLEFVPRRTEVLGRAGGESADLLVAANDRDVHSLDVYRMNTDSGRKTLISPSSPGHVVSWVLDAQGQPRAALSVDLEQRRWWSSWRAANSTTWVRIAEWDEQLRGVIIPLAFDTENPGQLIVGTNQGRDTLAVSLYDLGQAKIVDTLAATPGHDLCSNALIDMSQELILAGQGGAGGALLGLRFHADRLTTVWFDEQAARWQAAVDRALPNTVNVFLPNRKVSLVHAFSATEPGAYYLFNRDTLKLEDTGIRARPWVDPAQMRPVKPVNFRARDGLPLSGYLTLPATRQAGKPVPLVLHPHGGPWARDEWRFDPEVQFLASRGFAVLQVNFRGSLGYGTRHLTQGYKHWGDTAIDDLIDGVEWAVAQGYADRGRIGVYGASYGGYATLMALVRRPDLFQWGINYVGVTDLAVHQDTQPAQRYGDFGELAKRLNGDQKADAAVFEEQSPARHVDRIRVPVFHAYGGEDRNVDIENGHLIRKAFEKAGKQFEWMFEAEAGHGYYVDRAVFAYYHRMERFMLTHTPAQPAIEAAR